MQSDGPVSEFVTCTPATRLRPFVDRYIGYRSSGFQAGVHRGLPSRHMTFIVSMASPIDVIAHTDRSQRPDSYRTVLSGLQAAPALISHDGTQDGVAVELTPLGSRMLFGMPAAQLWDRSVELSDVVGRIGDELWERVQCSTDWDQRFSACDDVLARLAGGRPVAGELAHWWRALVGSGGQLPIGDLASATGYSRPHLTRRFRSEFGLGPKLAARVIRFERARRMLTSAPALVSPGQVAAACGYYDQAHLCRDVAQLAGCTPRELVLDEKLPFFQDDDVPAG